MQNDSNITNEKAIIEHLLGSKTEQIETNINLADKNVTKILSVSSCFFVDSTELLVGEVNFSGSLNTNVVYMKEDGNMENLKVATPFNSKYENAGVNVSGAIRLIPNIVSSEIEKMSNDTARVKTTVEVSFYHLENQDVQVYAGGDDDIFVMQSEIPLSNFTGKNCSTFTQPVVLDSKIPVGEILSLNAGAIIKKVDSLDSIVIFEGEVFARALVTTNEDRPLLIALSNFENFREEIEDGNAKKDSVIEACARVVCENVEAKVLEGNQSVEISIPIRLCYEIFENKNITITTDAYATKNEISLTTIGFQSTEHLGNENFDFKIDGNITLDESLPRIDKILAVDGSYITLTNVAYENRELLVEGILHSTVIYLNDDENSINSVEIEIPFSQTERTNLDNTDVNVKVETILYDVDATAKRGREIFIDGKIKLGAWFNKTVANAIISDIVRGEEIEQNTSAIEIYYAVPGQTIWDIAKDLKVAQEVLRVQNPELTEPLTGGEKVVYYNQKRVDI